MFLLLAKFKQLGGLERKAIRLSLPGHYSQFFVRRAQLHFCPFVGWKLFLIFLFKGQPSVVSVKCANFVIESGEVFGSAASLPFPLPPPSSSFLAVESQQIEL